jgi:hypothetical protein
MFAKNTNKQKNKNKTKEFAIKPVMKNQQKKNKFH